MNEVIIGRVLYTGKDCPECDRFCSTKMTEYYNDMEEITSVKYECLECGYIWYREMDHYFDHY